MGAISISCPISEGRSTQAENTQADKHLTKRTVRSIVTSKCSKHVETGRHAETKNSQRATEKLQT